MPGVARHRKPLAIGGGEDAAPPELTEVEAIVIVEQRGESGFEGILAEVPGGTPGQVVIGEVGEVGHVLLPEIARMGQQAGIAMGQERRPDSLHIGGMDQASGTVGPGGDRKEELREFHPGEALGIAVR
jgi:hypothetical protein